MLKESYHDSGAPLAYISMMEGMKKIVQRESEKKERMQLKEN